MGKRSTALYDASLAPATLRMYNKNLSKLLTHTRLTLSQLLSKPYSSIDRLVESWINFEKRTGGSFDYCSQAVNGLVHRELRLRFRLLRTRKSLAGWSRIRLTRSHPPITWEVTVMFASTMASWGYHAEAVAVLLAFDCLLRVGELTSLLCENIVRPNDPRVGGAHAKMALRLARTKTGLNQWVTLDSPAVASVLLYYLSTRSFQPAERAFPFSPGQFNRLLHSVADSLQVGHVPYVAHSFRHGGATCAYLRGDDIASIIHRGRWRRPESAARYIQTGRAILITHSIPRSLDESGRTIAAELLSTMTHLLDSVPPHPSRAHRVRFKL